MKIRKLMGTGVVIEIAEPVNENVFAEVFDLLAKIENRFSVFKIDSEISKINRGEISLENASSEMKEVLRLCEETKKETGGYFDIADKNGKLNPSGIVKGWALKKASDFLRKSGIKNFYINGGGDIEASGLNSSGEPWKIGIRNPFDKQKIVKTVKLSGAGIATSGTYERGQHIYNPHDKKSELNEIASITVIGPDVYEADRFATSAFAMGRKGIEFIEKLGGFEGYMIDSSGIATMTSGFEKYI